MEESKNSFLSNREVRSSAFTTYFSDPKNAAQLYAALDGAEGLDADIENIYNVLKGET